MLISLASLQIMHINMKSYSIVVKKMVELNIERMIEYQNFHQKVAEMVERAVEINAENDRVRAVRI